MTLQAIDAFWKWWPTVGDTFARTFSAGEKVPDDLIEAMSEHVADIHPDLEWEFGPGRESAHHLCLSGKGDPLLRVVTARWVKRGPVADASWEFYGSRQRSPKTDFALNIAGQRVDADQYVFEVSEDELCEVIHVRAFHPAHESMDDGLKEEALFLSLDNLLGEDALERWLGRIEIAKERPSSGISHVALRSHVDDLAARAHGERWAALRGETDDGKPIFVLANMALKRAAHLLLDMHLTIELPLLTRTDNGLPTSEEGARLDALEDELIKSLGTHAALLARETMTGRRTIHLRVMEGGPASAIVHAWSERHPERRAIVTATMDPRWELRKWP